MSVGMPSAHLSSQSLLRLPELLSGTSLSNPGQEGGGKQNSALGRESGDWPQVLSPSLGHNLLFYKIEEFDNHFTSSREALSPCCVCPSIAGCPYPLVLPTDKGI